MDSLEFGFAYDKDKTDLDNVFNFVEGLPGKFKSLINPKHSNFFQEVIRNAKNDDLYPELFESALREAEIVLEVDLQLKRRKYKIDTFLEEEIAEAERTQFQYTEELKEIGFTGNSLKLKIITLNYLWDRVNDKLKELGQTIIDFSNDKIVKLLRRFFTFLNSMLGSLVKFLPGLEHLKEFKEVMEAYFGIGEELAGF